MNYDARIAESLKFEVNDEVIYSPLQIQAEASLPGETTFTITNSGTTDLSDLGIYIKPSSNLGPLDSPADMPPATDYQDLLMWGTRAEGGGTTGGLKVFAPSTGIGQWVTRIRGANWSTRISIGTLEAGESYTIKVQLVTPSDIDSRRLYINVTVG